MDIERIQPALIGGLTAIIGMVAIAGVAQAYSPRLDDTCPVCGARFATYEELYRHFTGEHPTEEITIEWE